MKKNITLILFYLLIVFNLKAQESQPQSNGQASAGDTSPAASNTPPPTAGQDAASTSTTNAATIAPGANAATTTDNNSSANSDKDKNITAADTTKSDDEEEAVDKDGVPLDSVFKDENAVNAKIMEYPKIRQADVMFSKRIWREIPLAEKINKPMASPKQGIADVIINSVLNGELTAYANPEDGSNNVFKKKLSVDDIKKMLGGTPEKIQYAPDPNRPDYLVDTVVVNKFDPSTIKKIRLEEDWIVDTKRSLMEPRILAIALLKDIVTESGETLDGSVPLFWISFKQARKVLANVKVPNRHNDVANISYDALFIKRLFSSYIIKESNPENLRIVDHTGGQNVKALKESQRIEDDLLNREQDMWSW